ncbi:MAG TPA: hypothetical protein VK191_14075 [Symbiobacteriaceae bacterium]|nr:hypothetical protein [Symbiobacteriaceae bacterium]
MAIYYPTGAYLNWALAGPCSPYWGGFGHFALPAANGAGFFFPAYTFPFDLQSAEFFAKKAGFIGPSPIA